MDGNYNGYLQDGENNHREKWFSYVNGLAQRSCCEEQITPLLVNCFSFLFFLIAICGYFWMYLRHGHMIYVQMSVWCWISIKSKLMSVMTFRKECHYCYTHHCTSCCWVAPPLPPPQPRRRRSLLLPLRNTMPRASSSECSACFDEPHSSSSSSKLHISHLAV